MMKILFLSKRQYMGKDLLDDEYGRFFEIPKELAVIGYNVTGVCFSYRQRDEGRVSKGTSIDDQEVTWFSWNLGKLILPGVARYFGNLKKLIAEFKPDLIIASSDAIHVIIGRILSKCYKLPLIVDLYDNFESYKLTKVPGLFPIFRSAVASADGIICVSNSLSEYIKSNYSPKGNVIVVENGIPINIFKKLDKALCRDKIGLPIEGKIIGTAGALAKSRDIDLLFEVFRILSKQDKDLNLALAGPVGRGVELPAGERVFYFGKLAHNQVSEFLNCLDVAVVCNKRSSFGEYCYPQKLAEILACNVPVVAASTGDMAEFLDSDRDALYVPENADSLKRGIVIKLESKITNNVVPYTWATLAKRLDVFLSATIESRL